MNSDTASTSTSSSEYERKRKQQKKIKKKSKKLKKEKKNHKEKKRSRKESPTNADSLLNIKPIAPPRYKENGNITGNGSDSFGPALPPHLLNKIDSPIVIGPIIPADISITSVKEYNEENTQNLDNCNEVGSEEENVQGSYGPMPITIEKEMSAAQIELEKRALELKMAAIDGLPTGSVDQTVREEWMLELPDVGLKGGLAALNNMKRGFHQGKEKPDFSDRSSWTKTPQATDSDVPKPATSKNSEDMLKQQAQALYDKHRDAEQEALAKKHKKKHKRDESLVQIHQKKLRKEEKRKAKELKESGAKPERRPFSRDIDLKLNKIDSNQTKQIVDKAKILDSKFSRGHTKYL